MAFTPNNLLKNSSNILLRDQRHAARLFADDQFRLAPKAKWIFHVTFSINSGTLKTIDIAQKHGNEIGMLVKSVTLPKFTVATDQVNQYNRKKQIQIQHKYESSTIVFHDDNMGLINQLWQNYYSYYFADSTSAKKPGAYNRNAIRNSDSITNRFGLDNGATTQFFNYIRIYQMARHEYISYTLHNPIIQSWDHNKVAYEDKNFNDFSMSVGYESVSYDSGLVEPGVEPIGFGAEHYDSTPSPLAPNGSLNTISPNFLNTSSVTNNSASFLANLVATNNTYQNNPEQVSTSPNLGISTAQPSQSTGGIQDTKFPTTSTNNSTVATNSNVGTG
jgi:hypothetical protein